MSHIYPGEGGEAPTRAPFHQRACKRKRISVVQISAAAAQGGEATTTVTDHY